MTSLEKAIVKAIAIQPTIWMPFLVKAGQAGMKEGTLEYDMMFLWWCGYANCMSALRFWSVYLEDINERAGRHDS